MTEILDEHVKQLLSEAESRLAKQQPSSQLETKSTTAIFAPRDSKAQQDAATPATAAQHNRNLAVRDVRKGNIKGHEQKDDDAGPGWFGMPKTDPNDKELKRDMQLLQMRGTALDPKRHYKKESLKARVPRYAHVGRIVEGPTDFFSGRLTRKERKKSMVDELLAAEKATGKFNSKYQDIQSRKSSGKKAFYKKLVAQRRRRN